MKRFFISVFFIIESCIAVAQQKNDSLYSGNPVFPGWYADPEAEVFGKEYWIYPTYSAPFDKQVFFDAFSSPDLVHWTKHHYYFFFGANDIQSDKQYGGIGVAIADNPAGPFRDHLGHPLINAFHNGAQPIDQFAFKDHDGTYYLIYGGWKRCNIVRLKNDFTGFLPFSDSTVYKEITPEGYVEGPFMFHRNGKYYFMWSEGGWTGPDYSVAYAIGDTPFGPFKRKGKILQQDPAIATGAGHHSVINVPGTDEWYIVYHRRPLTETDPNSRVTCIDHMYFDKDGFIKPVTITNEGVRQRIIR
jgi:beta-xylosidase